jgi:hypothetical protein
MNARVDGPRLILRFIRHRAAQVSVLALLGFLLGLTVIGLAAARSSAQQAILDSAKADLGQQQYALQTGDPAVNKILPNVAGAAMPLQDQSGDIIAGGLSAPVLVRATTASSLRLGVIVRGDRPRRAGEITLSEPTAQSLGITIGDAVQVRTGDGEVAARVVGLSVDPANRTTSTVVQLVDESATFRPTMWLSDTDFYSIPALKPVLDGRTATYRSADTLLEAAAENRPHFLSAMQFLPAGCGLLMSVLLVSIGAVMSRRWTADAGTLTAAGMPPVLAWRKILSVVFGAVLVGEILGGCAAVVGLLLARGPVSAWVGQHWVHIAMPWQASATVLGLTVLAALVAAPLVRAGSRWAQRFTPHGMPRRWVSTAGTLAAAVGLVAWVILIRVSLQPHGDRAAAYTPLAAGVVTAAIPFVLAPALCWRLPMATRALMQHLFAGLRPIAAVGAIVVLTSSIWSAGAIHDANSGEAGSSPLEPASSFVVSEMPDTAIPALTQLYRSLGGSDVVRFSVPDESTAQLRVTGTQVANCMAERRTLNPDKVFDCFPQDSASPLNRVMLGANGATATADSRLVVDGKVGLLQFVSGQGVASRLADTRASPDPMLGGNLPGLVIAPDSEVAKEFKLVAAGTSEVVLMDFSGLTPHNQFLVRAAAIRLAPSAETASGSDPTAYDRLRSLANTVSFLGATTAMVIILLGGISLVVAHTLTRRTLVDVGAVAGRRWGIAARWTAMPLLTTISTIPLTYLTVSAGGQRTNDSYGLLWILPGIVGSAAFLIVGVAFLRTPRTVRE